MRRCLCKHPESASERLMLCLRRWSCNRTSLAGCCLLLDSLLEVVFIGESVILDSCKETWWWRSVGDLSSGKNRDSENGLEQHRGTEFGQ